MSTRRRPASDRSSWTARRKRVVQIFAAIGAVAGVLVSATSLVDWLQGKVDPPPPPPPARIDPTIDQVRLDEQGATLESYLESSGQSTRGLSRAELRERGQVFRVHVRLRGGVGERLPLRWTLYEARPPRRVEDPLYNQIAVVFVPRAGDHARDWPIWVPNPPRSGSYFLRAALIDKQRQPVAEHDSDAFSFGAAH